MKSPLGVIFLFAAAIVSPHEVIPAAAFFAAGLAYELFARWPRQP